MTRRLSLFSREAPEPGARERLLRCLAIADEAGVEAVWVPEAWGRDAFTWLTQIALRTRRLGLATGIVNVFSRTPALLAMTAASLDELSGGRVILGLGTSGANVIEHWHGVPFAQPLRRLREYGEIINTILRGEPLNYPGEVFTLERGFRLQFRPVRDHIPIYIAAITPRSIRQAGEFADGWQPIFWPKSKLKEGLAAVRAGAQAAGRADTPITVAPQLGAYVTEGPDDPLRQKAHEPVAFYVGRMGRFYAEMLARNGFADEVAGIQAAWARRDAAGAAAAVSDRMLNEVAIVGSLDECAEQVAEWQALGADAPILELSPWEPARFEQMLARLLG